jgi:hypothetical protein
MVEALDATAAELETEREAAAERARLVDSLENQLAKAEAAEAEALAKVCSPQQRVLTLNTIPGSISTFD